MGDLLIALICVVVISLIIYSVYRNKNKNPNPNRESEMKPTVEGKNMFKDELKPEHINSMYRLFTSSS